ncbi:hypothetical protein BGX31_003266, partial [Mortierella sp. GBA43]
DYMACCNEDGVVVWDVVSWERIKILDFGSEVEGIVYSPDGKHISAGCRDGKVRISNVETWECILTLEGPDDWIRCTAYSPQDDQLASSCDCIVRVWDLGTGECQMMLIGHTDVVMGALYTAKGDLLASVSKDKTIRVWDARTGDCRAVIRNLPGMIDSFVWLPSQDFNYLVAGCGDGSLLKWQVTQEEDQCQVKLCWSATTGALMPTGASIQDVRGLTPLNTQLLKQRGAVGEPVHIIREAGKKLGKMASVFAKLKQLQQETRLDSPSVNNPSIGQAETLDQSAKGSSQAGIADGEQNKQQDQPQQPEQLEQRLQLVRTIRAKGEPDTSDDQELPGEQQRDESKASEPQGHVESEQLEQLEQPEHQVQDAKSGPTGPQTKYDGLEQLGLQGKQDQSEQTGQPVEQVQPELSNNPEQQEQCKEPAQPKQPEQQHEEQGDSQELVHEQSEQPGQSRQSEQLEQQAQESTS